MSQSLNVIALVSGGKDSFFSLLHCLHNGHNVIALANLYPAAASETSDLNSYMYQTVGHTLIPLHSEALGIPLYRKQISGSAVNSMKDYHPSAAASDGIGDNATPSEGPDETESLLCLLREVMAAHPNANAVSSGAILSTYQRTRIESVALRLGLKPLSYLWQYPTLPTPVPRLGGLLEDMAAVGLDARIIKVASGGLDERLLWASLRDEKVRRKIEKDVARFGGSVLGEGGEYETLVVSGPSPVWKKRLNVREEARRTVQEAGGEYWIAFKEGQLTNMTDSQSEQHWKRRLNVPRLHDKEFAKLLKTSDAVVSVAAEREGPLSQEKTPSQPWSVGENISRTTNLLTISNITSSAKNDTVKQQMLLIKQLLLTALDKHNSSVNNIIFTTILLRSMQDFATVNNVYASLFSKPNPPARVTVACGDALPSRVEVMASFAVDLGPRDARHGLNVQSRSYWAPANIGPYSQAISVPVSKHDEDIRGREGAYLVYIAGQIPLVPASMAVLSKSDINGQSLVESELYYFWEQTCLSLQNLWRVGRAAGVNWWVNGIAFIAGNDHIQAKVKLACRAWKLAHQRSLWEDEVDDEHDSLDIWDQRYGNQGSFVSGTQPHHLPDFERLPPTSEMDASIPAFLAAQINELPRGCSIEWQGLGLVQQEEIKIICTDDRITTFLQSPTGCERFISISRVLMTVSADDLITPRDWYDDVRNPEHRNAHVTVYTSRPQIFSLSRAQVVPCKSIWDEDGLEIAAGVIRHVDVGPAEAYQDE